MRAIFGAMYDPKHPFRSAWKILCPDWDALTEPLKTFKDLKSGAAKPKSMWGAIVLDLVLLREMHTFLNTFFVGTLLIGVNITAVFIGLDATNVVMMILSLWFAIGVAFGPLIEDAKRGRMVWGGLGDRLARVTGWALGFGTLLGAARLLVWVGDHNTGTYYFPSLAAAGVGIAAGMLFITAVFVDLYQRFEEQKKSGALRLSSEAHRGFWKFIMLFGWFLLVSAHPVIKFYVFNPTRPWMLTPGSFGFYFSMAAAVILFFVVAGKIVGTLAGRRLRDRVVDLKTRYRALKKLDYNIDARFKGLVTQIAILRQQEAYRYARPSLEEAESLSGTWGSKEGSMIATGEGLMSMMGILPT